MFIGAAQIGLHDILTALRWVEKEIHVFGGDKACVTLFGQGEGAAKIDALLGSPVAAASGLFHRAVTCSAGCLLGLAPPAYAGNSARMLCEKLAELQTGLETEAAAAEEESLAEKIAGIAAHEAAVARREEAHVGLVAAAEAVRDETQVEMDGLKMSKLKQFAVKHGDTLSWGTIAPTVLLMSCHCS